VVVTAGVVVAPPNKPVDAVVVVAAGFAPNKPVDAVVVADGVAAVAEFPNENPLVPVTVAGLAAELLFVPKLNIFNLNYLRIQFSPEVMIIFNQA